MAWLPWRCGHVCQLHVGSGVAIPLHMFVYLAFGSRVCYAGLLIVKVGLLWAKWASFGHSCREVSCLTSSDVPLPFQFNLSFDLTK